MLSFNSLYLICSLCYLSFQVINNKINIGSFTALINSSQSLSNSILSILNLTPKIERYHLDITDIRIFFDKLNKNINELTNITDIKSINKIELKNVSFRYQRNEHYILKNINLSFYKNNIYAIIGSNGSGKSTIMKILLGLYGVCEGNVFIDDININKMGKNNIKEKFGVVFQDHQSYALTIKENIFMDRIINFQDNDTIINNSLHKVGLLSKTQNTKNGTDTNITKEFDSNGMQLSGGEHQKLSIARIFTRDYEVIILDEPTSSLDVFSETNIMQHIFKYCENKILIFITHDIALSEMASYTYIINDGCLIGEGNHKDLMKNNKIYKDMYIGRVD